MILQCGITDGRGKVCGHVLSELGGVVAFGERPRWISSICPKHDIVCIEEERFLAAQSDGRAVLLFDQRVPGGLKAILEDEDVVAQRLKRA